VAALIPAAFPTTLPWYKALRAEALLRVGAVALAFDFCQDRLARQIALKAITWIDSKVSSPAATALKNAILNGLGGGDTGSGDYVAGVYIPNGGSQIFTTPSGKATLELRDGAFNIPTLITIRKLSDAFRLTGFPPENQRAPFWDYDATNANSDNTVATHTLATPGTATMAFCFQPADVSYPGFAGAQIGHNPVGGGFEFVQEVPIPTNLENELTACPPPVILGPASAGGVSGLTNITWSSAGHYLAKLARTLFLPAPLSAAMVGQKGPIAGAPVSLSPFGLVLPNCDTYYNYNFCQYGEGLQ
jgi:hypothetical protein